jgi:hypothetical protein
MLKLMEISLLLLVVNITMASANAPEDYDLNTEISITGVIIEILERDRGPQTFLLKTGNREYHVITGPWWYLGRIGLSLKKDMDVEVTGSKFFSRDGHLYILVRTLKDLKTEKLYKFREDNLMPCWKGRRMWKR